MVTLVFSIFLYLSHWGNYHWKKFEVMMELITRMNVMKMKDVFKEFNVC